MIYHVTLDDIKKCFEFTVKYHLEEKKVSSSRTSGHARGLGEEIDSFLGGKLVEIAVTQMLKQHCQTKNYGLDFNIRGTNEVKDEPDINKITENGQSRTPHLFVEIKRTSAEDRWIGPTQEQFDTIKKQQPNVKKIYIVGASIFVDDNKNDKQKDLLGCYLRNITGLPQFTAFADINKCRVTLDYIISGKDLETYGAIFPQGGFFYETALFEKVSPRIEKQIKKQSKQYKRSADLKTSNLSPYKPIKRVGLRNKKKKAFVIPTMFFPLKCKGKFTVYKKKNKKSIRQFVECCTNVTVKSEMLGEFKLSKGQIYSYNIATVGRNPILDRNNIWIARNKLDLLKKEGKIKDSDETLKVIAEKI